MGIDKLLHFIVSFALTQIDPVLAAVAGIGKEIWDAANGGYADLADLLADALGIVAGLFV